MNELESPYKLASSSAQGHDGVGPLVVSRAQPAVVVGTCTSCRYKNQIALDIHRHDGDHALPAPLRQCHTLALCGSRRGIRRKRIPAPAQSAGARVIGPNHAARHVYAVIVVNSRAHDNQIVYDRGQRSHVTPTLVILLHIAQADLTGLAKIRTRSTARGIDRHQTGILC